MREVLDTLVRDGHPDAKRLKQASSFLGKASTSADQASAIREVLQATDVLVDLIEPRVVELRVKLGSWLMWAALRAS
jgi:hypothetical protein